MTTAFEHDRNVTNERDGSELTFDEPLLDLDELLVEVVDCCRSPPPRSGSTGSGARPARGRSAN